MNNRHIFPTSPSRLFPLSPFLFLLLASLACGLFTTPSATPTLEPAITVEIRSPTPTPRPPTETPPPLPTATVQSGEANEESPLPGTDEPVFITGDVPYTWPFFIEYYSDPFVMLEDEAGFVQRDEEFVFQLEGQAIGPVEVLDDGSVTYSLALPAVPQGTFVDVDNNGEEDQGVQVFAVVYSTNIWGGPFMEERDGTGWSVDYVSTVVDSERDYEITGGILVVWAPNGNQSFPSGFGDDGMLFTEDDPVAPIPAGYNLVSLDETPFRVWKEARPTITLNEGAVALNDYSSMDYVDAFETLFEKVSREYPFTDEKGIDWQALHDEFAPEIAIVNSDVEFYGVMRAFGQSIPDGHVGIFPLEPDDFVPKYVGSFGMRLAELSDGRVIVIEVFPGYGAESAGIKPGAEIIDWDGQPVQDALENVVPYFAPYSTAHAERLEKLVYLPRYPVDTEVEFSFRNPGESVQTVALTAEVEVESWFASLAFFAFDELALPVEAEILDDSGLGYIRISTFVADFNLMTKLWDRAINGLNDNEINGLIIDVRNNGGGSPGIAMDFAGFFFTHEVLIGKSEYYSNLSGTFEVTPGEWKVKPAPTQFNGQVAVLVGPDCVSACELFAYTMQQEGRATIVGHFPTAGAFGEVGQGQYDLPGGYSMQFPTGRTITPDGNILLEGVGTIPDIVVPVTYQSALEQVDAVLEAAIEELTN